MRSVNQDSGTKLNDKSMSYFPHCYDQNITESDLEYSWMSVVRSVRKGVAARFRGAWLYFIPSQEGESNQEVGHL